MSSERKAHKSLYKALSHKYAFILYNKGIIEEKDIEVQEYGMLASLSTFVTFVILFVLAAFLHCFADTLAFCISFTALRLHFGGWHAKTPLLCTLATIALWILGILLTKFGEAYPSILVSIAFASCIYLLVSERQSERKDRDTGLVSVILALVVSCLGYFYSPSICWNSLAAPILTAFLSVVPYKQAHKT